MSVALFRARKRIKQAMLGDNLRDESFDGANHWRNGLMQAITIIDSELEEDAKREWQKPLNKAEPPIDWQSIYDDSGT